MKKQTNLFFRLFPTVHARFSNQFSRELRAQLSHEITAQVAQEIDDRLYGQLSRELYDSLFRFQHKLK